MERGADQHLIHVYDVIQINIRNVLSHHSNQVPCLLFSVMVTLLGHVCCNTICVSPNFFMKQWNIAFFEELVFFCEFSGKSGSLSKHQLCDDLLASFTAFEELTAQNILNAFKETWMFLMKLMDFFTDVDEGCFHCIKLLHVLFPVRVKKWDIFTSLQTWWRERPFH